MSFPTHEVPASYFSFNSVKHSYEHKFFVNYKRNQNIDYWDNIMEDLTVNFGPPGPNTRWMYISTFTTMVFYFRDPEDLMLARLKVDC